MSVSEYNRPGLTLRNRLKNPAMRFDGKLPEWVWIRIALDLPVWLKREDWTLLDKQQVQ
jgi:hypothetical protein